MKRVYATLLSLLCVAGCGDGGAMTVELPDELPATDERDLTAAPLPDLAVAPADLAGLAPDLAPAPDLAKAPADLTAATVDLAAKPDLAPVADLAPAPDLTSTGGPLGSLSFGAPFSSRLSGNAVTAAVGDVDGDGRLDLVYPDDHNSTSVAFGNGDGTFRAGPTKYQTAAAAIAVGDWNGDGKLDFAAAHPAYVRVHLGDGQGNWTEVGSYWWGSGNLSSIATGDWNKDGKADFVIGTLDGAVTVVLGKGDGTFPSQGTRYATGLAPSAVIAGDWNGDGKADLATANGYDNTVSALVGNGDGTFRAATTVTVGAGKQPRALAAADLDGDGKIDLVTGNFGASDATLLRGQGDGTFTVGSALAVGAMPGLVATADVNGDGRPDLLTLHFYEATVGVRLNLGGASFAALQAHTVGSNSSSLLVRDWTGDGKLDVAVTSDVDGNAQVLVGRGDGTFVSAPRVGLGAYTRPGPILAGDWNGDGKLDLLVGYTGTNTSQVGTLLGLGGGKFAAPIVYHTYGEVGSLVPGDFTGDGRPDVLILTNGGPQVLASNGNGTFTEKPRPGFGNGPFTIAAGDFDGDGKLDAATGSYSGSVDVYLGKGDGTFQTALAVYAGGFNLQWGTFGAADLSGDGQADLYVGIPYMSAVLVLLSTGQGTFALPTRYTVGGPASAIRALDVDGDGKLDLVVGTTKGVSVLRGKGGGAFLATLDSPGGPTVRMALADFDRDGKVDVGQENQQLNVMRGNGDGTFKVPSVGWGLGPNPSDIVAADLDADGKIDVAATDAHGDGVSLLLNTSK